MSRRIALGIQDWKKARVAISSAWPYQKPTINLMQVGGFLASAKCFVSLFYIPSHTLTGVPLAFPVTSRWFRRQQARPIPRRAEQHRGGYSGDAGEGLRERPPPLAHPGYPSQHGAHRKGRKRCFANRGVKFRSRMGQPSI